MPRLRSAALVAVLALVADVALAAEDFAVTLLGTGTPPPLMHRFGPATLDEGGDLVRIEIGVGEVSVRPHGD